MPKDGEQKSGKIIGKKDGIRAKGRKKIKISKTDKTR